MSPVILTLEEAIQQIAVETPLSEADMRGFLACSPDEQAMLVRAYRVSGRMPSADAWTVVLAILRTTADAAGIVAAIAGAVTAVFGVAAVL